MGGSGGGSSGKVAYPGYVESVHEDWLNAGVDLIDDSITEIMNDALGASPYTAMTPYDPSTRLTNLFTDISEFETFIDSVRLTATVITNEVAAYQKILDDKLVSTILPRFEAGMRNIGAVVSSSFAVGKSILEDGNMRDVNKFTADLQFKNTIPAEVAGQLESNLMQVLYEANKLAIVAEKGEVDQENDIDVADAKWDLEVFQYGANLMAAPGGAGVNTKGGSGMMAGGLGAAGMVAGALTMGPVGAIAGGLLGIGAGLGIEAL